MKTFIPLLCAATLSMAATVHIKVDPAKEVGAPIPNTIFGTFLEPIGNSTYNGLWAEILQNPSFESGLWAAGAVRQMTTDDPQLIHASELGLPLPWAPLYGNQGNRYEPHRGDAANSFESVAMFGLPDRETGIKQEVYLPVHRDLEYRGSIYLKHISGASTVRISIRKRNDPEKILVSADINASATDWRKYEFKLELKRGQLHPLEPADFVISTNADERVMIDEASLVPADAIDGLDPDMVRMSKEMDTPLVRFGGNFTSGYHWRDGVGPMDKRVSTRNIAWGMPETNQFGTDEFLRYCELIGAEPQFALNMGTGTPEEAAEWVRYIDDHWKTHGGLLWELGNELWGNWNNAYPTLQQLPERTKRYSDAVRGADPTARLIATGQDPDNYEKWNAAQLTNPPGTFNYLSTHFVVTTNQVVKKGASEDEITADVFALPVGLERALHNMQKQIDAAGHPKDHIAFTEWLFYDAQGDIAPRFDNFGGAVAAGGFLNMLLRNTDAVPVSDMTGIIEFAGIWKKRSRVFATPAYYAFQMFSTAHPRRQLSLQTDSPTYDVHEGVTRIPDIPNVPYLDTVAVRRADGGVTVFCINRNLHEDTEADIIITGVKGQVEATELFAPSLFDENNEMRPHAIIPKHSTVTVTTGQPLHFTFRHASVTRLDFAH